MTSTSPDLENTLTILPTDFRTVGGVRIKHHQGPGSVTERTFAQL